LADPRDILARPDLPPERETFLSLVDLAEGEFSRAPLLLQVEPLWPVLFVGDTHGDLESAVRARGLAERLGGTVVLLGDYVDRGPRQVETLSFVLAWRLAEPERVVLLRGNHESPITNPYYGFLRALSDLYGASVYGRVSRLFAQLPYAALIGEEIFAVHGGVPKGLERAQSVAELPKGDLNPDHPVALQLLWNDPDEAVEEFAPSPRGPGIFRFGEAAFRRFVDNSGLKLVVRAHEFFPEGVRAFFGGGLLSVFSCRFYGGTPAAVVVEEDLQWRALLLR